ncbi:MAG: PAS domain S-box protein [Armatimonadetes bacterium]|jgi:PAS domain S-box-containing protein|nr:PAS domain S-box protein [Armatimonadota bacterium]
MATMPIALLISTPDGTNIQVNQEAVDMTGYSREELLDGVWMIDPADIKAKELLEKSKTGAAGINYETRLIRKDGAAIWVSISWRPMFDDDGNFDGVCTTMLDISEKKEAESNLLQTGERLRQLSEKAADVLWEMTADGVFTYVSEASRSLGYAASDWVGHNLTEFLPEETAAEFIGLISDNNRKAGVMHYEMPLIKGDGSLAWIEIASDSKIENGVITGYHGVSRDITGRKVSEQALRESEEKYKSIVENSRDIIALTKPNMIITYVSPACKAILGYEPEELIGTVPDIVHPDDYEWLKPTIQKALNGASGSNLQYRMRTKNGDVRWVSHSWVPLFADGKLHLLLSVLRDITDVKKSEDALRAAHDELKQAYKLQQEFLNNITHEVRTPLTAVKGYAEMLCEGVAGPLSKEQSQLLSKVLSSSDHLLEIVNGVLEIARLKSGKVAVRPRVSNPRNVVAKAVSAVQPQADKKGLKIKIKPGSGGCPAMYDRDKMLIVITNIISNAVKFTQRGSINIEVQCSQTKADIVITDTGIGISDSEIETIFDEFGQLDYPNKHKPSGFGVGLAIVAAMVESMGASLTVSSVKNLGTSFLLSVPVVDVPNPHEGQ